MVYTKQQHSSSVESVQKLLDRLLKIIEETELVAGVILASELEDGMILEIEYTVHFGRIGFLSFKISNSTSYRIVIVFDSVTKKVWDTTRFSGHDYLDGHIGCLHRHHHGPIEFMMWLDAFSTSDAHWVIKEESKAVLFPTQYD